MANDLTRSYNRARMAKEDRLARPFKQRREPGKSEAAQKPPRLGADDPNRKPPGYWHLWYLMRQKGLV